ncbi:Uncharacterised protein [Bordetella pertussis]|nr:Uncharacterised protein [Bordetella pertussis]
MDVPPLMLSCPSSSGTSSLTPIQTSSRPPTTFRNGMFSSVRAKAISTTRRMMAPAVPHRMPCMRCLGARFRHASAITTALSPPSRMSMRMIWKTAAQLSVWKNSSIWNPQQALFVKTGEIPGRPPSASPWQNAAKRKRAGQPRLKAGPEQPAIVVQLCVRPVAWPGKFCPAPAPGLHQLRLPSARNRVA